MLGYVDGLRTDRDDQGSEKEGCELLHVDLLAVDFNLSVTFVKSEVLPKLKSFYDASRTVVGSLTGWAKAVLKRPRVWTMKIYKA